jgi:hypothetical protein
VSALSGAKRMQFAGRRVFLIAVGCVLLLWTATLVIWMITSSGPSWIGSIPFILGGLCLLLGVLGAALWLAGWIVEGFAKADSTKPSIHETIHPRG